MAIFNSFLCVYQAGEFQVTIIADKFAIIPNNLLNYFSLVRYTKIVVATGPYNFIMITHIPGQKWQIVAEFPKKNRRCDNLI
jgi:hypothetical protein